jgi:hypothetical protein
LSRGNCTVRVAVLLVLAGSEEGGTASGELVGEFGPVVVITVDDLVVGLSLIGVCGYVSTLSCSV